MLWMFQRVYYGRSRTAKNAKLPDLSRASGLVAAARARWRSCMGIFPAIFLKPMEPSVTRVVERMQKPSPRVEENEYNKETGQDPNGRRAQPLLIGDA